MLSSHPETIAAVGVALACAALCGVARSASLPRKGIARPIIPERALANLYWHAWQVAWEWMRNPQAQLDFAASAGPPADALAREPCVVAQYAKYGWRAVQGARGLSALHLRGAGDDFIPRPESAAPLTAWGEWDLYLLSANRARLEGIFPALARVHARRQADGRDGSGLYEGSDAWGRLARSCQMALDARSLAAIAAELGRADVAEQFSGEYRQLVAAINRHLWDDADGWYREQAPPGAGRSAAGFWPLLAGVAGPRQVEALVRRLTDPAEFWPLTPVPAFAATGRTGDGHETEAGQGGVLPVAEYMIVRGLLQAGRRGLAKTIALEYLGSAATQVRERGGIFERTSAAGGPPAAGGAVSLGPIAMLIEAIVGLHPDAPAHALHWAPRLHLRHGVEGLALGANIVSVVCAARAPGRDYTIHTEAEQPFTLRVATDFAAGTAWRGKKSLGPLREGEAVIAVKAGSAEYRISGEPAPDPIPPAQPQRLVASRADGGVLLRWQACPDEDLAGYHVYRGEDHGWRKVSAAPAIWAQFHDHAPPTGGCRYAVAAVDIVGNTSPMSAPAELQQGRDAPSAESA